MDTNLIINFTNGGKKGSKAISNINPDKDNAVLKTFAQMVNGLTANTYVDATRVDKMSVEETPAPTGGLLDPQLACDASGNVTFLGSGSCDSVVVTDMGISKVWLVYLDSDGTYRKDWVTADIAPSDSASPKD